MSRRAASFVLGLALALLLGGALWWWLSGRPSHHAGGAAGAAAQKSEPVSFNLYFPSAGGGLRPESRALQVSQDPKDRIRKVVDALLAGPKAPGLARPFPEGVTLGSVLLSPDGTAYVDLHWESHADPPSGGSTEEIQRIYSVVDSIVLDVPQASRVVLLWNGVQRETFSGHLDLSVPLVADRGLLGP
jgi:spore germination protein GerM